MDKEIKYLSKFIVCSDCNKKAEFTARDETGKVIAYLCEACVIKRGYKED